MFADKENAWYRMGVYGVGLHLIYLSTVMKLLSSNLTAGHLSLVLATLGSIVMLWGAIRSMRKRWRAVRIPVSVRIASYVMPFAIVFLLMAAALKPRDILRKPLAFYPYLWVMIALGGVDEREWAQVKKALRIHALVGTIAFAVLLTQGYSWDYTDRESFFDEGASMDGALSELGNPLAWSRQLIYSYPILLLLFPEETWFWRGVGITATLCMTIYAILGQYRSALFLGVGLVALFSLYSWVRARTLQWSKSLAAVMILAASLAGSCMYLTLSSSPKAEVLNLALNQLFERTTGERGNVSSSSSLENVRFIDAMDYINELTFLRAVVGDQGVWKSPSGFDMHVGHLRYIIYGGLPTLIAVWLLVYWPGWLSIGGSKRLSVLAAASIAVMHSIQAIPAGMLGLGAASAMLFLCGGYCWHSRAAERTRYVASRGRL